MVTTRRKTGEENVAKAQEKKEKSNSESVKRKKDVPKLALAQLSLFFKMAMIFVFCSAAYKVYRYQCLPSSSSLATVHETVLIRREFIVPCSDDYVNELEQFRGCAPKRCGRFVKDGIVTEEEAKRLIKLVKTGMSFGGSSGGASILDLHTGALSKGDKFINIYKLIQSKTDPIFEEQDFILYRNVKNRIKKEISDTFEIPVAKLHLTKPTFFSRMTTKTAKTIHDEYWHPHVDKETYGSFHYTSLVYLADYGSDFTGGKFVFIDKDVNKTVEPRIGRLSFFTSGSENRHYVEKLESGTRFAVTVSFTCDPEQMILDPRLPPSKPKDANAPLKGTRT